MKAFTTECELALKLVYEILRVCVNGVIFIGQLKFVNNSLKLVNDSFFQPCACEIFYKHTCVVVSIRV